MEQEIKKEELQEVQEVQEVINYSATGAADVIQTQNLTEDQRIKINEIIAAIDVQNAQAVMQFGISAQADIASFSDTIINQVRTKDTGYVGEALFSLTSSVKELDVDALSTEHEGFLSKLFGGAKHAADKFVHKYEDLSDTIERLVDELDKAQMNLLKDIQLLDIMYGKNINYLKELECYIAAGEMKLKQLNEVELPAVLAAAEKSNDPLDIQKANDFKQLVNRFEKKIHDLKLSKMISIQSAPQIRLVQNGDQMLVEKIQTSIFNTIPLWKNQVVIAISILRQQKALKAQQAVTDTTNDLLKKNSELLKQNTIGIAEESEKGIVEIETLKKVNDDLIATLEETIKIQAAGKIKRAEAEIELRNMEQDLKKKLLSMKSDATDEPVVTQ